MAWQKVREEIAYGRVSPSPIRFYINAQRYRYKVVWTADLFEGAFSADIGTYSPEGQMMRYQNNGQPKVATNQDQRVLSVASWEAPGYQNLGKGIHTGEIELQIPSDHNQMYLQLSVLHNQNNTKNLKVAIYQKLKNANPTISGSDSDLGAKNDAFDITYQIADTDPADQLTVTERLNGNTLRTLQNAPKNENLTISVSREQLFALPLHSQNTIEIRVDDGKGGISYRRYTFRRTNSAPQISGDDQELGEKTNPFSVSFSATDQENDAMSAKLYLDDKLLKTYETLPSEEVQTYEISKLDFVQLNSTEPHKIRIEVRDKNAATSIRNLTFTRSVGRLRYQLTKETDQRAQQIIVSPTWFIAEGAVAIVKVCNNALDESPTWENATEQVKAERQFNFTNQTKTAEHWAVGVQITIERGEATETSWLAGFGGGYK